MAFSITQSLDLTGLKCPLPVLQTDKKLRELQPGDIVEVICTDPMSSIDLPHFCNQKNHTLLEMEQSGEQYRYVIEKGSETSNTQPD